MPAKVESVARPFAKPSKVVQPKVSALLPEPQWQPEKKKLGLLARIAGFFHVVPFPHKQ